MVRLVWLESSGPVDQSRGGGQRRKSLEKAAEMLEGCGGEWRLWAIRVMFLGEFRSFFKLDWLCFFKTKVLVWEVREINIV